MCFVLAAGCKSNLIDSSFFTEGGTFPDENTYQSKELGWKINIPDGLSVMSVDDARKILNRWAALMKSDLDIDVNNDSTVFRLSFFCDSVNYFFCYSVFSEARDNTDFREEFSEMYTTMSGWINSNMQNAKTDTGTEVLGGRMFNTLRYTGILTGESVSKTAETFNCLINGQGLYIGIYSTNTECRNKMYEALKNSSFIVQ